MLELNQPPAAKRSATEPKCPKVFISLRWRITCYLIRVTAVIRQTHSL
jgi:hypothetical protein